jgi:hypothetical protein
LNLHYFCGLALIVRRAQIQVNSGREPLDRLVDHRREVTIEHAKPNPGARGAGLLLWYPDRRR